MGRVEHVTRPRSVLLLLILIVGSGLILSMIKMSETKGMWQTNNNHDINLNNNYLDGIRHGDSGPTVFKDNIVEMYEEDRARHSSDEEYQDSVLASEPPTLINIATDVIITTEPQQDQTVPLELESVLDLGVSKPTSSIKPTSSKSAASVAAAENPFATESDDDSNNVLESDTASTQPEYDANIEPEDTVLAPDNTVLDNTVLAPDNTVLAPEVTTSNEHPLSQTVVRLPRHGPVHVLLLTEGRSGSTWLSSFFWNLPAVYYTFEPLYQTKQWKSAGCGTTQERRAECEVEVLSKFWSCDFLTSPLSVLGRYPNYHQDCAGQDCSMKVKQERCSESTHRVAKTIRLWDLTHIEEIMSDPPAYDVRVIHLVRDPRPLLKSRLKGGFGSLDGIHKNHDFADEVLVSEEHEIDSKTFESQCATVCKRLLETSQLGDNPPEWLKNRYVRISHEQMSLHPIETAKMLYDFVDLEWTEDIENYIYNTTVGEIGKTGMFGIGHISTDVINQWKRMKDEQIKSITEACLDTIRYLGYESDLEKIKQWKLDNDANS